MLVDQDVRGMHIADFLTQHLELVTSPDHVVQQIPDLRLQKLSFDFLPIHNLSRQHELEILVFELHLLCNTCPIPLKPHMPVVCRLYCSGSSNISLV